jgi:hypothetical protein
MTDKLHFCTKDDPWTPDKTGGAIHPDAKCVREYDDWYDGCDLEDYKCPHCGMKWTQEISR